MDRYIDIERGGGEKAYLLAEDQLVIKEKEDSLLAASIRLIDPRQLPSVDELRAPVQDIVSLDTKKTFDEGFTLPKVQVSA